MLLSYTKKPPTKSHGGIPSVEQGEKAYHRAGIVSHGDPCCAWAGAARVCVWLYRCRRMRRSAAPASHWLARGTACTGPNATRLFGCVAWFVHFIIKLCVEFV